MSIQSSNDDEYFVEILDLLRKGVYKFGKKGFVSLLQTLLAKDEFETKHYDKKIKFIIKSVLSEFRGSRVDEKDLFKKEKRGDVTVVRRMCVILMKQHLKISMEKLGHYFGRTGVAINATLNEYKKLDRNNPQDKKFLDKYDILNHKISLFIQEIDLS